VSRERGKYAKGEASARRESGKVGGNNGGNEGSDRGCNEPETRRSIPTLLLNLHDVCKQGTEAK
jgi:hypothetical protein